MKTRTFNLNKLEWFFLIAIIFEYTVFFTHLSIAKYLSFFSFNGNPLAEDNNMLWHTIRGKWFYQSIGETLFNSDASLFYALVAAVYKIFPHIYAILALRHLAIAASVIPIYVLCREKFESGFVAILLGASYLLFNPLHHLSFVDDESLLMAFSLLFILFAFLFFEKRRFTPFLVFCVLAIVAKEEDSFFMVPMFSVLAFIKGMPARWKTAPLLLGLAYLVLDAFFILPVIDKFTDGQALAQSMYITTLFGHNPEATPFLELLTNNLTTLTGRIFSLEKLLRNMADLARLFDPWIFFLSFLAPEILLLGLPVLPAAQIASYDYFICLGLAHHMRYFIVFMFIGALYGSQRLINCMCTKNILPASVTKRHLQLLIGIVFLTGTAWSNFGDNILLDSVERYKNNVIADQRFQTVTNMYDPAFYTQDERDRAAWQFIHSIPKDASVSTTQYYLAALSDRDEIYHFGATPKINSIEGHDFDADFVFVNKQDDYAGYGGIEVLFTRTEEQLSKLRKLDSHELIKEDEFFVLFKNKKRYGK